MKRPLGRGASWPQEPSLRPDSCSLSFVAAGSRTEVNWFVQGHVAAQRQKQGSDFDLSTLTGSENYLSVVAQQFTSQGQAVPEIFYSPTSTRRSEQAQAFTGAACVIEASMMDGLRQGDR